MITELSHTKPGINEYVHLTGAHAEMTATPLGEQSAAISSMRTASDPSWLKGFAITEASGAAVGAGAGAVFGYGAGVYVGMLGSGVMSLLGARPLPYKELQAVGRLGALKFGGYGAAIGVGLAALGYFAYENTGSFREI